MITRGTMGYPYFRTPSYLPIWHEWHWPPETTWDSGFRLDPLKWVLWMDHNVYRPQETIGCLKIWNPITLTYSHVHVLLFPGCFIHVLRHVETNQRHYIYIYIYMLYIIYGYISHQPDIEPYNISQCNISLFIYITRISICPYQLLLSGFWSFLNPSFNQCSIFFESQSKHHLPQHETSS